MRIEFKRRTPIKTTTHMKKTAPTRFGKRISLNQTLPPFILLMLHTLQVRHQYYYTVCTKLYKILTVE